MKRPKNVLSAIAVWALYSSLQPPEQPAPAQPKHGPVLLGWNDEFDKSNSWTALNAQNKVGVVADKGKLKLVLGPVPSDWPYQYQWSGLERVLRIDIARYPYLIAKVDTVSGYAHLDIEALDAGNKPFKSLRASILQSPGISSIDLSQDLDPAIYSLRIRLIVGGPNTGCSALYDWIRFTSVKDGKFLLKNPDYSIIAPIPRGI